MKKSKIFYLIIISLLFFSFPFSTLAYTTSDYYSQLVSSPNYNNLINQYQADIDLITSYIEENGMHGKFLSEGKYIILYRLSTFDSDKNVRLIDVTSGFFRNYYGGNYDIYKRFEVTYSHASSCNYSINNDVVSVDTCSEGTYTNYISYPSLNCNPTTSNCDIFFSTLVSNTNYLSSEYSSSVFPLNLNNPNSYTQIPFKLNNIVHLPETSINVKEFFDKLNGSSFNKRNTYEDVNIVTYKILDRNPGLNKELRLRFDIEDLNFNSSNIIIYKYGSNIYTSYTPFSCSTSGIRTFCDFVLHYDVSSYLNENLMFDFVFNGSYNLDIYDTDSNNKIFINRNNIEYDYNSINFKEKGGLVLYPKNYDLINLIYNSSSDDFKFLLTNVEASSYLYDENKYNRSTTYEQDFSYKNSYLYKNSNNYWQYNIGDNYTNINNISFLKLPFTYNSSFISNDNFPCFVIKNANYLGNMDSDNKDIYIYYNSSLFNINYLKTVSSDANGSFEFQVTLSDGDIIQFTSNGSQISNYTSEVYTEGHDWHYMTSNFVSSYNNLLELFKDKIIIFFGLLSNFYNTMPLLFRNAFSFIFILVIAVYLYRLLL